MKSEQPPDISFLILRAFYNMRGLLDRLLVKHNLAGTVQAGMGPILYALYDQDGCTVSEIGARVQLAVSTVNNTVKKMHESDLVDLARDKTDRRAVRVTLTRKAKQLRTRMFAMREEVRQVLGGGFSDAQQKHACMALLRMIEAMDFHEWESQRPESA